MLPGAMYDAAFQCDMQFPGSKVCPQPQASGCENLWCLTNTSCYSLGTPKADGTKCGENKWCIHKKCVDMGTRPAAVHGGWGDWGPMGPCSRSCGGGLKYSERECDRPVPANRGRYCLGERRRLFTCNTTYVFFNPQDNPGIDYKYYVRSTNASYTPKYMWDFVEWSECNAKCDGGTMVSEPSCIEEQGGRVTPNFCNGIPRPEAKSRICSQAPCPAKWRVSQWSKCSACDGKKGMRHRKVQCVRPGARPGEDDVQANLDACKGRVPRQKEECIGTRPCRTMCPKKTRRSDEQERMNVRERADLSPDDRRRMIDRFVDLGLVRYLERTRDKLRDGDELEGTSAARDFRQVLRDWATTNEDKRKRTCDAEERFTTLKPGSIIKDSIPIGNVVLMQAPYMDESLQSNLSDKAFQEAGDRVGVGIDTSQAKVYRGAQAVKLIEQLAHHNLTAGPRAVSITENEALDPSQSIDTAEKRR
ncbi:A disintegrin and metalloproteinase with thrombospondin motifs 7-like [Temnothorax americanus]|uniref:A disintegrin and metalloproteinase with thrombospondin motifs 7-like n=1 Tax=Temnothorax americanus TaxID=1964332 RepID=UPI0040681FDE